MNKSQLVEALANAKNLPLKKAEEIVSIVFEDMEQALINGERVEIRGMAASRIKNGMLRSSDSRFSFLVCGATWAWMSGG